MRFLAILFTAALAVAQGGGPKQKPRTDWKEPEKATITSGAVRAGENLIYVVNFKTLTCRTLEDGEKVWVRAIDSKAPPVVRGDQVWVALDCYSAKSGEPVAGEAVVGEFVAPPGFSKDFAVAGTTDGKLHCIDLESRRKAWTVELRPMRHRPALAGGRVHVIDEQGRLSALSLRGHKEAWRVETHGAPVAQPVVVKRHIYQPAQDEILVLDSKDGTEVARIPAKGIASPVTISKDVLMYGTRGGAMVRVDAETRREIGRISVSKSAVEAALVAVGGQIFGMAEERIFAIHRKTGALVWVYDGQVPFTPPLITAGGLFAGQGNVFYCLR